MRVVLIVIGQMQCFGPFQLSLQAGYGHHRRRACQLGRWDPLEPPPPPPPPPARPYPYPLPCVSAHHSAFLLVYCCLPVCCCSSYMAVDISSLCLALLAAVHKLVKLPLLCLHDLSDHLDCQQDDAIVPCSSACMHLQHAIKAVAAALLAHSGDRTMHRSMCDTAGAKHCRIP